MATTSLVELGTLCLTLCLIIATIRRIYFSRISHIPGPRLAALTYLYQFYYDAFPHHGQFLFQLERLHGMYGPIVRIGPDEVHINDIAFYGEMYPNTTRKRDKSALWFWMAGDDRFVGRSTFSTLEHDLHRRRRGAFGQFFSKLRVQQLEPRVEAKVALLRDTLLEKKGADELVDLRQAFGALTMEVISEYAFGKSINVITSPDMGRQWTELMLAGPKVEPVGRMFPGLMLNMDKIPQWLLGSGYSEMIANVQRWRDEVNDKTRAAYEEALQDKAKLDKTQQKTVLHEMVRNELLSAEERTFTRISADGTVLLAAGTETTSRTLAVTFYHILKNPSIHAQLLTELHFVPVNGTIPLVKDLESLPFLTAVINEGLRIAHGTTGRFVRIAPDEDLTYAGNIIPRGVTMAQSHYLLHTNPTYFPDPFEFKPERFLAGQGYAGVDAGTALKSFVPWGKGPRACVGLNLATAELYLTIAVLLRSVKMELFDTHEYDTRVAACHFIGYLPEDSKGIRVRILGKP